MQAILGQKKSQTQKFLENGTRIPVTVLSVAGNVVTQVKQTEKDGYTGVQIGFGSKKHPNKALLGHIKKAGLDRAPRIIREIRLAGDTASDMLPAQGDVLKISEILKPGDMIDVTGTTKGKGFAGVVKRHHFRGGPRTHGQSDRERAPGSIGQTTTPGRVYRGKRMAGHMGNVQATVTNLQVVDVDPVKDELLVKGLVPGGVNSIVMIEKTGEVKKFVSLIGAYKAEEEVAEAAEAETAPVETAADTVQVAVEETVAAEPEVETTAEIKAEEPTTVQEEAAAPEEVAPTDETVSTKEGKESVEK